MTRNSPLLESSAPRANARKRVAAIELSEKRSLASAALRMDSRRIAGAVFAFLLLLSAAAQAQQQKVGSTNAFRYAGGPISVFAANPTDWITLTGTAGKKVTIVRLVVCATTTNPTTFDLALVKHSSVNAGGTSASVPGVNISGTNVVPSSVATIYTVNPTTIGAIVGTIDVKKISPSQVRDCQIFGDYGGPSSTAPALMSANQQYALNLGGLATAGLGLSIDWQLEVNEQ